MAGRGINAAHTPEFTLDQHFQDNFHKFEKVLATYPEVTECHLISGGYDYLVNFVVKSIGEYRNLIDSLLEREKMISKYFSYIVIKSPIANRLVSLNDLYGSKMHSN